MPFVLACLSFLQFGRNKVKGNAIEGNKDPVSCSLSSKETYVKEKAQKKPPLLYIEGVSATARRVVEKSK